MDRKRRIFRLIEVYLNDFRGSAVEEMYGKGTKIKVHTITFGVTSKSIILEAVVVLGELINEEIMTIDLAEFLVRESMVYFFPEHQIKTYVRFDV